MSTILKQLITNPVYKCIKNNKNPFLLLDIYEHSDLYEEVKVSYRDVRDGLVNKILLLQASNQGRRVLTTWELDHHKKLNAQLSRVLNDIEILDNLSKVLPVDELMTYELL